MASYLTGAAVSVARYIYRDAPTQPKFSQSPLPPPTSSPPHLAPLLTLLARTVTAQEAKDIDQELMGEEGAFSLDQVRPPFSFSPSLFSFSPLTCPPTHS